MASAVLSHVVADLTLGKPSLFWLPTTASVRDALRALKHLADDVTEISIWDCACCGDGPTLDPEEHVFLDASADTLAAPLPSERHCHCVGKVCMQSILCYLASHQNSGNLVEAFQAPVMALFPDDYRDSAVQHIDPQTSLQEALQLLAAGVQNLIVPITESVGQSSKGCHFQRPIVKNLSNLLRRGHGGQMYCWLSHEDVLRFLLGSIGVYSPLPLMSIQDLGIIETDVYMVRMNEEVASALELIKEACAEASAVAVVEEIEDMPYSFRLVGDISRMSLQECNETAAFALATIPAGAFVMYAQEYRHPPEVLVDLLRAWGLEHLQGSITDTDANRWLGELSTLLQDYESWEDSSSDGEESGADSPTGPHDFPVKGLQRHRSISSRVCISSRRRSGPIFCNSKSSLVAVLLQALARRENYVWVTEEDGTLLGIVTFLNILAAMAHHVNV